MSLLDDLEGLIRELNESTADLSARRKAATKRRVDELVRQLHTTARSLDPVAVPSRFFDPSDPRQVGRFVGLALVAQPKVPLGEVGKFYGSGVYALYYDGGHEPYEPIAETEHPIYAGKADPANGAATTPQGQGSRLYNRLNDHRRSIQKAANLAVADFKCRYLVVQSGWQTAAESHLIEMFKPIWNSEVGIAYGVGKHGDSSSTRANKRSPWDTLHPGRGWAWSDPNTEDQVPLDDIIANIQAHYEVVAPLTSIDLILKRFFDSLRQDGGDS